ncbi:hypothetical protein AB5N19_05452 [Seiridium cardinale]
MKSVIASIAVAVLAGLVDAKASFTNTAFDVEAGESFTLTWVGGTGPFQILLKDGPSTNLETVETLVASSTAESATVTLPSSLTTGMYAFEIVDTADSESNYSSQFTFVGSAASSTVTSASSTMVASSTAASSSSASASASASTTTITTASASASASASTTGSTTGSSSTLKTTTTSSSSTRTSSSASSTSTVANTNDGRGLVAPFLAPLILAAVAAF